MSLSEPAFSALQPLQRLMRMLAVPGVVALTTLHAGAQTSQPGQAWRPSSMYLQLGTSGGAQSAVVGAIWNWEWRREYDVGTLTGYWDLSVGGWRAKRESDGSHWSAQLGLTPVFRLYPKMLGAGWFVEGGIGINVIGPIYKSGDTRFSTAFNFGDQIGFGRRFGEGKSQEVSLRVQHFSNAGIKHPNPGENFLQLRYARDF